MLWKFNWFSIYFGRRRKENSLNRSVFTQIQNIPHSFQIIQNHNWIFNCSFYTNNSSIMEYIIEMVSIVVLVLDPGRSPRLAMRQKPSAKSSGWSGGGSRNVEGWGLPSNEIKRKTKVSKFPSFKVSNYLSLNVAKLQRFESLISCFW